MPVRQTWTEERANQLRQEHAAIVATGKTKKAACAVLKAKWKIGENHMMKIMRYGPDHIRTQSRKYSRTKTSRSSTTNRPRTAQGVNMTVAEALQFYNFCRQLGINIA